jgi:expansin (peptidoglycan-binding protein)
MDSGRHRHGRGRWPLLGLGVGGGLFAAAVVAMAVGLGQVMAGQACAAVLSAAGTVSGIATHYAMQSGGGNCSYPGPPADKLYVALSPSEYDSAAQCGSYLEVSGPDGSVRVEVVDQCPPCATGHIDLSATAFAKIAPLSAGLVRVTYRTLVDPPLPGPVALRVSEGSSRYWLSLLVINTGNPVASVQVESASSGWRDLVRPDYNYWIAQPGAGAGPFTVKVTDTLGHQITVRGVALERGVVQDTGTWMYGANGAPAPASARATPISAAPATTAPATTTRRGRRSPSPVAARSAAPVAAGVPMTQAPTASSPSAGPSC